MNRHVALVAFDLSNVSAIEARAVREHILRPAILESKCPYRVPDVPLNILHLQQFPTRAAAIKWLLDWALKQKPAPELKK